jgi:hypothetical protein
MLVPAHTLKRAFFKARAFVLNSSGTCLPSNEVSQLLAQTRVGFLDYGADYAAKSSVFAAYAAHGVVPFLLHNGEPANDGLAYGTNFLHIKNSPPPETNALRAASTNIVRWYRAHGVGRHAKALLGVLAEAPARSEVFQTQR